MQLTHSCGEIFLKGHQIGEFLFRSKLLGDDRYEYMFYLYILANQSQSILIATEANITKTLQKRKDDIKIVHIHLKKIPLKCEIA